MLIIDFPGNCNGEHSRWSYTTKLSKIVMDAQNTAGQAFRDKQAELYAYLLENGQYINPEIVLTSEASEWDNEIPTLADETPEEIRVVIAQLKGEMDSLLQSFRKAERNIFRPSIKAVLGTRNEQVKIAETSNYWNPKIPDHVQNGAINYPPGLNQDNEGSRGIFLLGLERKLMDEKRAEEDADLIAVGEALSQAKKDAREGTKWEPSLGDIING